jgi:L-serine kinase (ADP)
VSLPKDHQIDLRILFLDKLIPHEQVIPSLLDSVQRDMRETGYQRDPIIIDKNTNMVLDGMHRHAALRSLSAKFALCACFNYLDETIILQRWLRHFSEPDREMIDELIDVFDFESTSNYETAMKTVDSRESPIALLSRRQSYLSKEKYDLENVCSRLEDFDEIALQRKIKVEFHPENDDGILFLSESDFVLYPMPLEKEEIMFLASSHKLLPFKTTRHVLPVRPMGVNYPLDLLKQDNIEICDSRLQEIISRSEVDLVRANSLYEGRKYSEALAIFKRDLNS